MADRAEVVPLRRRGAPEFPEPAEIFVGAGDPTRALSVSWAPDQRAIELSIQGAGGPPSALILSAEEVLDLVRALVEGLPQPGPAGARPPAVVLPLKPRESHPVTTDT